MRETSARKPWRYVQGSILVGLLLAAACAAEPPQSSSNPQQNNNNNNTCLAPNQVCNGICISPTTDPANCGGCGRACVVGQACVNGACAQSCVAPQVACGAMCADRASNALHCGGCNQPCGAGQICQNSTCVTGSCPAGQMLCSGACVDTQTNVAACGATCTPCLVGQTCQAGVCTTPAGSGGAGSGGGAGASSGGSAGIGGAGGTDSSGGTGQGGSTGGSGTGGSGTSVPQSASCPNLTWPSPQGSSKSLGDGMSVGSGQTYDGGMAIHNGSLENCADGDQSSTDPLITVANNGTVKNVIMGNNVGDGIHCQGSCTIENVWFPAVCDDAITILGSGTVTIRNSGFKNARDKTIQHNGTATVNIENVYVETAGKLYRSCGDGCSGSSRTANISNIIAIGVDQVAGVSENDNVSLTNICVHKTFSICAVYEPGSDTESETGVNSSNDGPNENCNFDASDTHALLSRVTGIPFTTESVCGGPNGYKSGSTATNCVPGFDKCLKACMPGGFGFKEISCGANNRYEEGDGIICAMPTDSTAAANLAPSRVMTATTNVTQNGTCNTEWAIGRQSNNNNNYCVCTRKPGYYSNDNWLAWDCQPPWW